MKYRPRHLLYVNASYNPYPFEIALDFRYWSEVEEIDNELIELGLITDGELRVPVFVTENMVKTKQMSITKSESRESGFLSTIKK